jgi:hypothetical protein
VGLNKLQMIKKILYKSAGSLFSLTDFHNMNSIDTKFGEEGGHKFGPSQTIYCPGN